MSDLPRITVVLPIRNEERFIAQTLAYVLEQDYPRELLEVLVVDGESDDRTPSIVAGIAAQDSRVRLLTNPHRLSSAARTIGAKAARGDIVTFIDGHTYIDNTQLLRTTARLMAEKEVDVLSRPQFLDTPDNSFMQRAISLARKSALGHGLDSTIYTGKELYVDPSSSGASYRRTVFDEVGYFDERFDACEDVEFNYRVYQSGRRSFTSLALAVYYYPRTSLRQLFRQMSRYGAGRFRLARKHPETLSPTTLLPVFFILGLVGLPLLALAWPMFGWLFLASYGLYLLLAAGTSLAIAVREGLAYFFPVLATLPVILLGLGYGFLAELGRTLTGRGVTFE